MADASSDSIAIVTGTTAGLGQAVARHLLGRGWRVVGIARRPAAISHPRYHHIPCDLASVATDPADLDAQLAPYLSVSSRRVGLVNNAASPEGLMPLANLDPRQLARLYAINVVAPLWLMGRAVRAAATDSALRIVNVSSGAATTAFPGLAAYGSSKAAVRLAGMSLAREWDPTVRAATPTPVPGNAAILSYEPGIVDTDMQTYARTRAPNEFPWVTIFLDFQARGLAVPAERPACDIAEFLESERQPLFAERRLQV